MRIFELISIKKAGYLLQMSVSQIDVEAKRMAPVPYSLYSVAFGVGGIGHMNELENGFDLDVQVKPELLVEMVMPRWKRWRDKLKKPPAAK
jgi:hypothetical protein